jgi:hypothetical protein
MQELCDSATRIGSPDYVPSYMILHGMNAITDPASTKAKLVPDFDAEAAWSKVKKIYLHCT